MFKQHNCRGQVWVCVCAPRCSAAPQRAVGCSIPRDIFAAPPQRRPPHAGSGRNRTPPRGRGHSRAAVVATALLWRVRRLAPRPCRDAHTRAVWLIGRQCQSGPVGNPGIAAARTTPCRSQRRYPKNGRRAALAECLGGTPNQGPHANRGRRGGCEPPRSLPGRPAWNGLCFCSLSQTRPHTAVASSLGAPQPQTRQHPPHNLNPLTTRLSS